MAFSYSDNNFTVIGNLCFVHIVIDGTEKLFDIPTAISDRMLVNKIIYPYLSYDGTLYDFDIGFAVISNNKISMNSKYNKGYFMCYFPIDSNK